MLNGIHSFIFDAFLMQSKYFQIEYLVKWKGYSTNECQWVKSADMHCKEVIDRFVRGKQFRDDDCNIHFILFVFITNNNEMVLLLLLFKNSVSSAQSGAKGGR